MKTNTHTRKSWQESARIQARRWAWALVLGTGALGTAWLVAQQGPQGAKNRPEPVWEARLEENLTTQFLPGQFEQDDTTGNPQIIIEENFTDGQFDELGSGDNGRNWQWFGNTRHTNWLVPQNRTGFNVAAGRRPSGGGPDGKACNGAAISLVAIATKCFRWIRRTKLHSSISKPLEICLVALTIMG